MQLDHTLEANQRFRPIQCPNKELDESRPSKKIERKTREERTKHKAQIHKEKRTKKYSKIVRSQINIIQCQNTKRQRTKNNPYWNVFARLVVN